MSLRKPHLHAVGRDGIDVDLEMCCKCEHYRRETMFDTCTHPRSLYSVAGRPDHHTIAHMRTVGACRREASLFSPLSGKSATGSRNSET